MGIPTGTFEPERGNGRVIRNVALVKVAAWEPSRCRDTVLNGQQLAAYTLLHAGRMSPVRAYEAWRDLRCDLRPEPNGKVVAGCFGITNVHQVGEAEIRAFEWSEGIPHRTQPGRRSRTG